MTRQPRQRLANPDLTDQQLWFGQGRSLTLSIESLPSADRRLLQQARDPNHATLAHAALKPIKDSSFNQYLGELFLALGILRIIEPSALDIPLATRFTHERLELVIKKLTELRAYEDTGLRNFLHGLRGALRRLLPHLSFDQVYALEKMYGQRATPRDNTKNLVDVETIKALGRELMADACSALATSVGARRDACVMFRDGIMICTAVEIALRRSDLVSLTIGESVKVDGDECLIRLPTQKTGARCWHLLAHEHIESFKTYCELVRPLLLRERPDDGALWLSQTGKRLTACGWYQAITYRTAKAFGKAIFPHMVRHILAADTITCGEKTADLAAARLSNNSQTVLRYYMPERPDKAAAKVDLAKQAYSRSPIHARPL